MKKFQFSMEKLQNYKEQILESEKNNLGILQKELNQLKLKLDELMRLVDMKSNELEYAMLKSIAPADFAARKRFITFKQQEVHELKREIALKQVEVETQLQIVIEATKEVSTLEKLEERQFEEHKYAEMKEEELFIEEFVSGERFRKQISN
ncbi:MAG: flagellar export protein FliJ [Oscillospiraceae bacterium]|nr:flagellar export protein FliJ [Oscillospiraceae bacterium]